MVLSRVRFLPRTADEVPPVLDRGVGWEPLVDSAPLVPGPLVVRLADGEILRLEVPESHELILPDGVLVPVELDLPDLVDPESEPEPTTSTTVEPSAGEESPTSDSTTPPTVGSNQSTTSSTSSSSTTAPSSTAPSSTSSPSTEPGQSETENGVDASTSTTVAESDPAPTTSTTETGATEPADPSTTVPAIDESTSSSEASDP